MVTVAIVKVTDYYLTISVTARTGEWVGTLSTLITQPMRIVTTTIKQLLLTSDLVTVRGFLSANENRADLVLTNQMAQF